MLKRRIWASRILAVACIGLVLGQELPEDIESMIERVRRD